MSDTAERRSGSTQRAVVAGVILALIVAAAVYAWHVTRTSDTAAGGPGLRIGVVVALSGAGADWGQTELNAVTLAVEDATAAGQFRSSEIRLESADAPADNVPLAVSAYRRIAALPDVYAIVGPTWDDAAAAIAPAADQLQKVTISSDASSGVERSRDFPNFFSVFVPEQTEMESTVAYLKDASKTTFATIYNQDPFSQVYRDTFVQTAESMGLRSVGDFPVSDPSATDFRALLARVAALKPDAIYFEMADQATKGPLLRQLRSQGITSVLVSSSTTNTASLLSAYSDALEGVVFSAPRPTAAGSQFAKRYHARFGKDPTAPSAPYAYDATQILLTLYRRGIRGTDALRQALLSGNFSGVSSEKIRFNEKGRVVWTTRDFVIEHIVAGRAEPIAPQ